MPASISKILDFRILKKIYVVIVPCDNSNYESVFEDFRPSFLPVFALIFSLFLLQPEMYKNGFQIRLTIAFTLWCLSGAERFMKKPDLIKSIDQTGRPPCLYSCENVKCSFQFISSNQL